MEKHPGLSPKPHTLMGSAGRNKFGRYIVVILGLTALCYFQFLRPSCRLTFVRDAPHTTDDTQGNRLIIIHPGIIRRTGTFKSIS